MSLSEKSHIESKHSGDGETERKGWHPDKSQSGSWSRHGSVGVSMIFNVSGQFVSRDGKRDKI